MKYIRNSKNNHRDLDQTISRLKASNNSFTHRILIFFFVTMLAIFYANYSIASDANNSNSLDKNLVNNKSNEKDLSDTGADILSNNKISQTDIVIGNRDAKLLFIEYFAPTCTHCAYYHLRILPELKSKYIDTGKIAYVMREFVGNKQDFDASLLARCKGDVDSYLKLSEHLLLNQDSWAYSKDYREKLFEVGGKHEISKEQYNSCLNNESKTQILFDHAKLIGSDKDFIGTPSFYINGEPYQGEYTIKAISEFLETILTKEERR